MALYTYKCPTCGPFDLGYPIGTAPQTGACPTCSSPDARRVFSPPRIGRGNDPRMQLIDSAKRSAHEPEVVEAIPSSGRKRVQQYTTNPRHAQLPRP